MILALHKIRMPKLTFIAKGLALALPIAIVVSTALSYIGFGIDPQNSSRETSTGHRFYLVTKIKPEVIRGMFVAFHSDARVQPWFPSNASFIKRVVGVPGDTVLLKDMHIFVNGNYIADLNANTLERYHKHGRTEFFTEGVATSVPAGQYLLMNNHPNSFDSRYWGFVSESQIFGTAHAI